MRCKSSSLIILALILVPGALAFGVSYSPAILEIAPGQSADVNINLQNMVSNEPATVSIEWVDGQDIAKIIGQTSYILQPRTETNFIIRVTIPLTAKPGDIYNLKLNVNSAPTNGGRIEITPGYTIEKPVLVVSVSEVPNPTPTIIPAPEDTENLGIETPQSNKSLFAVIVIMIAALAILIAILMKKRNQ